jgi:hypothetical protein
MLMYLFNTDRLRTSILTDYSTQLLTWERESTCLMSSSSPTW